MAQLKSNGSIQDDKVDPSKSLTINDLNTIVQGAIAKSVDEVNKKYANALEIIQLQSDRIKILNQISVDQDLSSLLDKNAVLELRIDELQQIIIRQSELINHYGEAIHEISKGYKLSNRAIRELDDDFYRYIKHANKAIIKLSKNSHDGDLQKEIQEDMDGFFNKEENESPLIPF